MHVAVARSAGCGASFRCGLRQGITKTTSGTLKEFDWNAPHAGVLVEYKNEKGETAEIYATTFAPPQLARQGFAPKDFKPGQKVELVWHPARSGAGGGLLVSYLLSLLRIGVRLVFFQHGAEKLWGFAGARTVGMHFTLVGLAGPLEVGGGLLLALGLFTRTVSFSLCGERAVAYFTAWRPADSFPLIMSAKKR